MKFNGVTSLIFLTLTAVIFSYNNCSGVPIHEGVFGQNSESLTVCDITYSEVYEDTFLSLAKSSQANCAACHTRAGAAPFAHSDPELILAFQEFLSIGSDAIERMSNNLRQSGGHQNVVGLADPVVDAEQTKLENAAVEYENCLADLELEQ